MLLRARRIQQGEAHRAVVGLVASVLRRAQDGDTVTVRRIGEIEPLMVRNFIFFCQLEILVVFADVDVGDDEIAVERGRNFRGVKSFIQYVAVVAPVTAKNEENAFVRFGGVLQRFGDFFLCIHIGWIEVFLFGGTF